MANKIIIGPVEAPILTFENPKIHAIAEESAVSLIGAELAVDALEPVLEYEVFVDYDLLSNDGYRLISADGYVLRPFSNYDLRRLPYATKLSYYINDRIQGEFYSKNVERVGRTRYRINAVSAVGLMDKQPQPGGMYTGQSFETVLAEILGDSYNYAVTEDAAKVQIRGYIPYADRRTNLHKLITAYGINIIRADTGGMLFTILGNSTPMAIPEERIYVDGNVDYGEAASRVEVTEHSYFHLDNAPEETLFDNTTADAVVNSLIKFDKPFYPDSIYCSEGSLEITERHVNYVRVTGTGILMGKPYTHTTRIVAKDNESAAAERVVQLKDDTLVTAANADNVLLRLAEFYFNATVIRSDIVLENEKCGRVYEMLNAFYERSTGFLTKISSTASGITKSSCEFIENYSPTGQGNTYTGLDILTAASGTWEIPASVFEKPVPYIRVVLIGPGEKGKNGEDGEAGETATETAGGKGGAGGLGGEGGAGGKVLSMTIDCTGFEFFSFVIGSTVSFRGNGIWLNSDKGASSDTGFLDVFSGTVYALPGKKGQDGGDGGLYKHTGAKKYPEDGESVVYNGKEYAGGKAGELRVYAIRANSNDVYIGGSGAGGAAVGAAGGEGQSALWSDGGDGANAVAPTNAPSVYGTGGNGGNGGGGSGGGAYCENWNYAYSSVVAVTLGVGGTPGLGSEGTPGAAGCILIYH